MDDYFDSDDVEVQNKELIITDEFKKAFNLVEHSDSHVFITGDAGTGKSTWLRYFRQNTKKRVAVLAPTGIAAVNVYGQTIHSFFRWPPRPMTSADIHILEDSLYHELDVIVIDEISMVRADMMDLVDEFLQANRGIGAPFGGCQMVLIGDLLQLPPVMADGAEMRILEKYGCEYFFAANVWQMEILNVIKFTQIFRQQDPQFIEILNRIRNSQITYKDLDLFNSRRYTVEDEEKSTFLCSLNKTADSINAKRIEKLPGEQRSYHTIKYGKPANLSSFIPETLTLKPGAKIMMLMNDSSGRWQNGTIGHVVELGSHQILVNINGVEYWVQRHKWDSVKHKLTPDNKVETQSDGHIEQFPLKVAYAISIHKSQGQTFDSIIIDFGNGTFAPGMAYVAISRCKTMEGIYFSTPLRMSDMYFDKKVLKFLELGKYVR